MVDLSGTGAKVPGVYVLFLAASAAFLMRCLRRRIQLQKKYTQIIITLFLLFFFIELIFFIHKTTNTAVQYIPGDDGDDCDKNQ